MPPPTPILCMYKDPATDETMSVETSLFDTQ